MHLFVKEVVLLSTADWGAQAWTNKQHVAWDLSKQGHRVLYVEGIGLRAGSLDAQDCSRILRRVKALVRPLRKISHNLHVLSLPFLPNHASPVASAVNKACISTGIGVACKLLAYRAPILWTYHPLTTMWIDVNSFGPCLYHCVDDIAEQPGMPKELIKAREAELAANASLVVTTSTSLETNLKRYSDRVHCLYNAVDYAHFNRGIHWPTRQPPDVAKIPEPRCVFVGALSGYKVDFELLSRVATLRPNISFVLIGQTALGEVGFTLPFFPGNVYMLGPKPYGELPAYLSAFSVGLLPYRLNAYTGGVFPMKFFEYLAAGLPVVATKLPSLEAFSGYYAVAEQAEEFASMIDKALASTPADRQRGTALAAQYTYQARTRRVLALLSDVMEVEG